MRFLPIVLLLAFVASAQEPILPPVLPWDGPSRALLVKPEDPWATFFERNLRDLSPPYADTVRWLEKLCDAAPELRMVSLGKSHAGRDVWMVVAARGPMEGKPVLLAQGGIHAGEIDGKDAGLMLLRDMTVKGTKRDLLDNAVFLFIPILSVDGHERASRFGRVNQRGPLVTGWRTNARNLNLNRDYAKLDTPELRAALKAIRDYAPDLYVDIHVTDGADYQYDITWGYNGKHAHSPHAAAWMEKHLDPDLNVMLKMWGHIPGPLVFAADRTDMKKGNHAPTFLPRYSNGYGDLRHLPTILVENHSLKPYEQRVLGTYVYLEACLRALGEKGASLKEAVRKDLARRPATVPLTWKRKEGEPRLVKFLGVGQRLVDSPISGAKRVIWTGEKIDLEIPLLERSQPNRTVTRPAAYWIPPGWPDVVERLEIHGVKVERMGRTERKVTMARITSHELAKEPFEGRVRIEAKFEWTAQARVFPQGSVRVPTDQPLGDLAITLLEPDSPDSFFQWGFCHSILQRAEYIEGYVMEPMAERMLERDPELKAAFERMLVTESFRKDPAARLRWFYERTPYFDPDFKLYPIAREEG